MWVDQPQSFLPKLALCHQPAATISPLCSYSFRWVAFLFWRVKCISDVWNNKRHTNRKPNQFCIPFTTIIHQRFETHSDFFFFKSHANFPHSKHHFFFRFPPARSTKWPFFTFSHSLSNSTPLDRFKNSVNIFRTIQLVGFFFADSFPSEGNFQSPSWRPFSFHCIILSEPRFCRDKQVDIMSFTGNCFMTLTWWIVIEFSCQIWRWTDHFGNFTARYEIQLAL